MASQGYEIITATDGEEALDAAAFIIQISSYLDVMMPKLDGVEVCRLLKGDATLPFMPIILVTAKGDIRDIVDGLESGGDEYLTKPVDHGALMARVSSILRIKALHDTVQEQSDPSSGANSTTRRMESDLEQRVAEQLVSWNA